MSDAHLTVTLPPHLAEQARRAMFLASLNDAQLDRVVRFLHALGDDSQPHVFRLAPGTEGPEPAPVYSRRPHVPGESLLDRLVSL